MCWSASVSMNTFVFGLFASVFALYNGVINVWMFMFFQSFLAIQLLEYFIWSKTFANNTLSKVGFGIILLQPIFSMLMLNGTEWQHLLTPLLIAYGVCFIVGLIIGNPVDFRSVPGPNGHLSWKWLDCRLIGMLLWFAFFFVAMVLRRDWILLTFLLVAVIASYTLYHKTLTWGSMWCWVANGIAFWLVSAVFYRNFCSIDVRK